MTRNKSNLPFFYATLSRVDGDTYYVALCNTDTATVTELPAHLSFALAHSDKPIPQPGDSVECFYEHAQVFVVGYAPFHTAENR